VAYYNFFISRSWLVSVTARRVYLAAAFLTMLLAASWLGIQLALASSGETWEAVPDTIAAMMRFLLFAGVIGTATLWIAMIYYLFSFDRSSALKRTVWAVCFWLFGPISSLLYHFFVYRRQTSALPESSK